MIAMSAHITVETTVRDRGEEPGALGRGLRRLAAGHRLLINHFTAAQPEQQLVLAPALPGDILTRALDGSLLVQADSWLASTGGVAIDVSWQGIGNAVFSGEGLFWVRCKGQGELLLASYGSPYEIDVDGAVLVDTGHVVAFEDTLDFRVTRAASSWVSSVLSGEGLACRFEGKGKLLCQSHGPPRLSSALATRVKRR